MRCPIRPSALLALLALAACADQPLPTATPHGSESDPVAVAPARSAAAERARLERLARRVARALRDPEFRAEVKRSIDESGFAEHKVHFGRFLGQQRRLEAVARINGEAASAVRADLEAGIGLELYLPVPAHRQAWTGDERVLVATALTDTDAPIAFDLQGRRHTLDPRTPPATPVIAVVPQETDFDAPQAAICNGDACGGGGSGALYVPGLYMTRAHFNDTFEGWLKGDPEFEVHILGRHGQTDSLRTWQCIGEHASGSYRFDQNGKDWTGSVLLFSNAQLDAYKAQQPGQSLRVFVVEDDDTSCVIKTDPNRVSNLLKAANAAYGSFTGGRDTTATNLQRTFKKAQSLWVLLKALASFINTNDELVGNAIESSVVGEFYPGGNWVVKGDNNITNGWLQLEMR